MQSTLRAVREDLEDERKVFPEFKKSTSAAGRLLLFSVPPRRYLWLPQLLFHSLLLFLCGIVVAKILVGGWDFNDTKAVLIFAIVVITVRLLIHATTGRTVDFRT